MYFSPSDLLYIFFSVEHIKPQWKQINFFFFFFCNCLSDSRFHFIFICAQTNSLARDFLVIFVFYLKRKTFSGFFFHSNTFLSINYGFSADFPVLFILVVLYFLSKTYFLFFYVQNYFSRPSSSKFLSRLRPTKNCTENIRPEIFQLFSLLCAFMVLRVVCVLLPFFCVVSGHFFSFLPCKCSFFCSGISPIHARSPPKSTSHPRTSSHG